MSFSWRSSTIAAVAFACAFLVLLFAAGTAKATAAAIVFVGPLGAPEATGSYNGAAAVSALNESTAIAFLPTGFIPTNTSATAIVGNAVGATSSVTVPNTIENAGNAIDSLTVSISAPTGWGVQIFNATSGGIPSGSVLAGSTTSTSATYTFIAVAIGGWVNYAVTYTLPPTATAFTVYDLVNTLTSVSDVTKTNTTHNDLIPGGPVALINTQTLDPTTCPSATIKPGCVITYTITYINTAQASAYCPAIAPTSIPSFLGGFYARGLTITENGATGANTWGAIYRTGGSSLNTAGLNALATDTVVNSTTFPTGNLVGSTAFTALVGGTSSYILAPGCSGTIKFSVTISPN